jgi:hypothetical protein
MNVFGCSAAWFTGRKAEALGAMAAIGIVAAPCDRSTQETAASVPDPSRAATRSSPSVLTQQELNHVNGTNTPRRLT